MGESRAIPQSVSTGGCGRAGTDQLEVSDANGALLVHVLLVLVLDQALHQVPRVNLVVCHILGREHTLTLCVSQSTIQSIVPSMEM